MLLCDDEPTVLEGLRRLFLSAGALVDSAESIEGFEAILADEAAFPTSSSPISGCATGRLALRRFPDLASP